MTGSLQVKRDTYYAVVSFKDKMGNWKYKWISTNISSKGNNKRKAEQKMRDIMAELESKQINFSDDCNFVDLLTKWMEISEMKVDRITYEGYEKTIRLHILPYFKALNLKVSQISPMTIQDYFLFKLKKGRANGKGGLSVNSVRHHRTILNQTFDFAIRNRMIGINPVAGTELAAQQKYEADFYNLEEAKYLLDICDNEVLKPILLLTVYYGLRRSEVLGLKWDAIDFTSNTLTIKHTVVKQTTLVRKDKTKNTSSKRSFPILDFIRPTLLAMKEEQERNKELLGSCYHDDNNYIFRWADGRPVVPDYVTGAFRKFLKQKGLRQIRFHDLRHSCGSILYSIGFGLKDIQEWLGHSDIKVTGNIYAHLETKRKMDMATVFASNLSGDVQAPEISA